MATRPSLQATYSTNHTTVFVRPQLPNIAEERAFVFCQWKKKACARDSFGHGVHTALFNASKGVRRALCLRPPAEAMPFPMRKQGVAPQSPLRPDQAGYLDS